MRRGKNRREKILGAFVLNAIEPDIAPRPQDVDIDGMGEIFDVEDALVVDGHRSAFGSARKAAGPAPLALSPCVPPDLPVKVVMTRRCRPWQPVGRRSRYRHGHVDNPAG